MTFRVGPPVPRLLRHARLPDVAVIFRLPPFAVGFEIAIKHSVSSGRSRFTATFGSVASGRRGLGGGCFLFGRGRVRATFTIGQGLLARLQRGFLLGQTLLLVFEPLRGHPLLNLALDFSSLFLLGLLLLARDEKRQGGDERENGKLLHGVVRQGWFLVIRSKTACRPYPDGKRQILSAGRR